MRPSLEERFWSKVDKNGPIPEHCPELGNCWVWTRAKSKAGYGKIGVAGAGPQGTHRVAWILAHGSIPEGINVLHRCDNPSCVRLDHLFLGTFKDNTQDMLSKGRDSHGRFPLEMNPNAKVNAEKVREIRIRFADGELRRDLADEHGLEAGTVSKILSGQAWPDAGGPVRGKYQIGRRSAGDHEGEEHVCISCGYHRKNIGRRLCGSCYAENWKAGTLDKFPLSRKKKGAA